MATDLAKTDVVIVGLGAAGGVAALPLAQAGLDVVGIEAGSWLNANDFAPDELRNNYRGWPQAVQKANREIPTHRPNASAPYSPRATIHPMMNAVGGTTLHYWAQSWRLSPWDFKVVSETTKRYGASRLPKGSTVEDWPFGLEELEPFYDRVEREIGVSGKAGNIKGRIDRGGNIFEGSRAGEYPMPPLRGTGFTDMMSAAARGLGWHAFPGPAAINTRSYQNRTGCVYHGYCSRGGCHVNAKGSTAVTTIPRAIATKRLTVVSEAHATRIDVNEQGRVTGVTYLKGGTEYFQPADVVLVASYTYENARLLLLSKSKAFPRGLSNNHGQVGRHYFTHNQFGGVTALFPRALNNWYGLPAQGVAVDNWADDNFDHSGLDFIGGGNLWVYSDRRPIGAASMSTFGRAPQWGSAWKAFIKENADRTNTSYLQKTTLPYEDNYLDLDPEVTDPLGFPVCRITADFKDNERKAAEFIQDRMAEWYMAAGAVAVEKGGIGTMGPATHAYGGTRMGDNPDTNVVDRWGFSHEAPNLGVLGASVMGTSGARNPTLTAQALAWRTAERLVRNWRTIALGFFLLAACIGSVTACSSGDVTPSQTATSSTAATPPSSRALGAGAQAVLSDLLLPEFRRSNASIERTGVTELRVIPGGYVVIAWGSTGARSRRSPQDDLFGVFIADSALSRIERVLDLVPSPRKGDYELGIERLTQWEVVIAGRGARYGDQSLRRAYPLDAGQGTLARLKEAESIVELSPASFPQLPAVVRTGLEGEGCMVPQDPDRPEPHNVVSGHFAEPRQLDWAVLCSVGGYSTVRIYWGGLAGCAPLSSDQLPNWRRLEQGKWSRTVDVTPASRVRALADALGLQLPLPIHDGVDDRYCHQGRWQALVPLL